MEGDTTHLVGDNPGAARRSTSYTQPFEFEQSSQHYTAGLHRVMVNRVMETLHLILNLNYSSGLLQL